MNWLLQLNLIMISFFLIHWLSFLYTYSTVTQWKSWIGSLGTVSVHMGSCLWSQRGRKQWYSDMSYYCSTDRLQWAPFLNSRWGKTTYWAYREYSKPHHTLPHFLLPPLKVIFSLSSSCALLLVSRRRSWQSATATVCLANPYKAEGCVIRPFNITQRRRSPEKILLSHFFAYKSSTPYM